MRTLSLLLLLGAVTGCGESLERTLEKVKPGEAFPKVAGEKLPPSMQGANWKVITLARATSNYPLRDGGELCRAGAYLLEQGQTRQVALITLCGGTPVPTADGSTFVTFAPARGVEGRTRLDLTFSVALGPQREVVWLTERTMVPNAGLHLQERAYRDEGGKLVQVLDHRVSAVETTASAPEAARQAYLKELIGSYAAGFTGDQYPVPFTMRFYRRGRPYTLRLTWQEGRGYQPPPLIPAAGQPPVSAPEPDGGAR